MGASSVAYSHASKELHNVRKFKKFGLVFTSMTVLIKKVIETYLIR